MQYRTGYRILLIFFMVVTLGLFFMLKIVPEVAVMCVSRMYSGMNMANPRHSRGKANCLHQ